MQELNMFLFIFINYTVLNFKKKFQINFKTMGNDGSTAMESKKMTFISRLAYYLDN
jgi:hypothetical protein